MHHFFQTWQLSFSFSFSFHKLTDVTLSCPFFAIISKPPYCLVIAPSSPLSSDSPIRRRLSGAGSVPRAPWLALLLQLPILHTETWLVSVVLCKAPSFYTEAAILPRFCYIVQGYRVDVHGVGSV